MKAITKKSLDELARTMCVIPISELDDYWGMYNNDCFWRCASYVMCSGISEAAAASLAYSWYVSEYGASGDYHLSTYNDSGVDSDQMKNFLRSNSMIVGDNSSNRIVGVYHTSDLQFYKDHPEMASSNHCLVLKGVNSDGSYQIFDPQNNVSFTVTNNSEKAKLKGLNCNDPYT